MTELRNLLLALCIFVTACGPKTTAALNAGETCLTAAGKAAESQILPTVESILASPGTIASTLISALVTVVAPDVVNCAIVAARALAAQPAQVSASPADLARNAQIVKNADAILAHFPSGK